MKISNNALNFLLAQYRAIFKRAYVKGIASAVLLTAGLAAGQAQAAVLDINALPDTNETATITGSDQDVAPEYQYLQLSGTATDFNGTVDVTAGYAQSGQNAIIGNSSTATDITGTGTLNISIENANEGQGVLVLGDGSGSYLSIGAINVTEGALKMSSSGTNGSGAVTVAAGTINIGTEGATAPQAWVSLSDSGSSAGVTLGRVASGSVTGSEISVLGGGLLTMQGSGSSGASIVGNSLRIATGGVMLTDVGTKNTISTDNFTVESGAFKVISGSSAAVGETFQGHTATVESGGNFLVGQSGTWTIDNTTDKADDGKTITTQVTFKNGSNVQIDGNIVVSGGLLTIESGAGLHATTAGGSGAGVITVQERAQNQGLKIDSNVLQSFLTSGDTYNDITTDASGAYILKDTTDKDAAGSIHLSQGRLTFSDTEQVELSAFKFASGSSGSAGTIVLQSGTNTNVIAGHDIYIATALNSSGSSGNGTKLSGANLHVTTDFLTLGDGKGTATSLTQLSGSGIDRLTIRDGLTVNVANNGFFKIDLGSQKVDFTNSDESWISQINGNLEFAAPSNRTFIKGKWDFNDDVKLSQSESGQPGIIIGHDITQSANYDTYVTFKGDIINGTSNGGYNGIVASAASNASTEVDLTQATLRSDVDQAGMIAIGASKGAVIKINGNQFSNILNSVKGNDTVEGAEGFALSASSTNGVAGVIEVTTPVTRLRVNTTSPSSNPNLLIIMVATMRIR